MSMEDQHLEEAYEDRYTTSADWEIEDEINQDEEERDDAQEEAPDATDNAATTYDMGGYVGRHQAGVL